MLGVGKAAPAQFRLLSKRNLRRTCAAGQKAGMMYHFCNTGHKNDHTGWCGHSYAYSQRSFNRIQVEKGVMGKTRESVNTVDFLK